MVVASGGPPTRQARPAVHHALGLKPGCLGEAFRTNYKTYPVLSTAGDLQQEFHGRSALRGFSILRPEVRSELLDLLDAELVQRVDGGGSAPQDLLDSFYVRHRLRRWFGTYEELGEAGRVFPLYSLVGLQAAFALGPMKRRLDSLHFAVMRKACADLAKMPFADRGWSEELISDLPDADDYRNPPVQHEGDGPAPTQWRPQRLLDNLGVARDLLVDENSNPLYEIIDREAVLGLLRDPRRATPSVCRQLFGALAAAVWLGGHESPTRIGTEPRPPDMAVASTPAATVSYPSRDHSTLRSRIRARLTR